MSKHLLKHENGHVTIVNENAGLVDAALAGSDCNSVVDQVSYALDAIKQLNEEYEARTRPDATQAETTGKTQK